MADRAAVDQRRPANAGQVVAYGVLVRVLAASDRGPDAPAIGPGKAWGRVSAIAPEGKPITRVVAVTELTDEAHRPPWIRVIVGFTRRLAPQ